MHAECPISRVYHRQRYLRPRCFPLSMPIAGYCTTVLAQHDARLPAVSLKFGNKESITSLTWTSDGKGLHLDTYFLETVLQFKCLTRYDVGKEFLNEIEARNVNHQNHSQTSGNIPT